MKLLKLALGNFKGIRHFELDANGKNIAIFGNNATGKTTLFDAFLWLLFDKDSQNKKDFAIKTLDDQGQVISGIDHSVEGVFEIDGNVHALKKVYSEVWTKKRGGTTKEMTGHTTDHFIDGVPVQKKEYDAFIASITDESVFKLLTNPTYFNEQLHWQERRKILLEVCGDITDEDVIDSNSELINLSKILNGRDIDKHRKVIAARRAEINKELEKIPVRIDEVSKGLPDVTGLNMDNLNKDVEALRTHEQEKISELSRIQTGGKIAEKNKQLRELEGELIDLRNQHKKQIEVKTQEHRERLKILSDEIFIFNSALREKNNTIKHNIATAETAQAEIEKLRDKWREVSDEEFEYEQDDNCPTCGQALPREKLAVAREKALADFNRNKAEKLTNINAKGKSLKGGKEAAIGANSGLEAQIKELEFALKEKDIEVQNIKGTINASEHVALDTTKKDQQIDDLKQDIQTLQFGTQEATEKVERELKELELAIKDKQASQLSIDAYNRGQIRIKDLMEQEKELATEFEQLEQELYLCEQFVKTKVSMLDEKINSRFKYAKFKLFNVQVNGGIEETCETLFNGIPYSSGLNNAAKINVGLDIINTLAEHYGFDAPIFVDNAEAVTQLIETKGQIIELVVSKIDEKLRVEVA